MKTVQSTVYLLDDDAEVVRSLTRLLRSRHFEVRGFTSVRAFLAEPPPEGPACLVLDLAMPELDGLELCKQLQGQGYLTPVIFLTGQGDVPMSVRAMKSGALDFLTKPVEASVLVQAVRAALKTSEALRQADAETAELAARLATLSPREQEVLSHVVAGQLNKQIAADLGTGERNIKLHRAHIMQKMGLKSVPELVRAALRLGVQGAPESRPAVPPLPQRPPAPRIGPDCTNV